MKKISSIDRAGYIKFVGDKRLEVDGTKADCDRVGGVWSGTKCVLPKYNGKADLAKNNKNTGRQNQINGVDNFVQGNGNTVTADSAIVTGRNANVIRFGEFTHAFSDKVGRAQRSVLMFQGRTTDANYTEMYLGGVDGKRFIVDEAKECIIGFEAYVLAYRVDSGGLGECMNKFQHATFETTSGTLTQVGSTGTKTNNKNHASAWNNRYTATSGTPDYIKVECKGHNGHTIDWTVILYVNELRTDAI